MIKQVSDRNIGQGDVGGDIDYFSSFEDIMRRKSSSLRKYQDIIIGNHNLWKLAKFEFITTLFGPFPGMFGYFSRRVSYPFIFRKMGKGTVFGRNVTLRHTHKIEIGKGCVIDEYCMLSAQGDRHSHICLGNEVLLSRGTVLNTKNGFIKIGDYTNIGANCRLGTMSKISLGKHVLVAANCYVGGAQHKFQRLDVPISRQGYENRGGVRIEDDVWLGAGAIVLDGTSIGTGSVIGAGSIVNNDIPPYSVAIGAPAKARSSRRDITH